VAAVQSCLAAANWDIAAAHEALRLKGLAAAVKKSSRHASEGLVAVAQVGLAHLCGSSPDALQQAAAQTRFSKQ
jgi:translation elongation factor EF-Ts